MNEVTDPNLIAELDAHTAATNGTPVTDPALIAQLDALSPTTSAVGAAGRGALDALPFGDKAAAGVQAALDPTPKSYKDYLSELDTLVGADKEQHPIAHYAGEAAGTVAPFAIPGVGEALGAESLAGRAGVGAALGAAQGASNNRDSSQLPTDVLKGAGVGAIAQPAVGALGDLAGKAFSALTPSSDELVSQGLAGVLGPTTRQVKAMGKDPEAVTGKIADWFNTAKAPNGEPLMQMGDHLGDTLGKTVDLSNQVGKFIGDTAENKNLPGVPLQPIAQALQKAGELETPDVQAQLAGVAAKLNSAATDGTIPFTVLHDINTEIGHKAFPLSGQVSQPLNDAYHIIHDAQNNIMEQYGQAAGIDKPAFDAAKHTYSMTSKVIPMLRTGNAKEIVNGSKLGSMLPAAAMGAVTGSPLAGLAVGAGTMVKPAAERIGKQVMFKTAMGIKNGTGLPGAVAGAISGAGSALPAIAAYAAPNLSHPAMAPFVPTFNAALQGVTDPAMKDKTIAVVDSKLQQSNPAYAKTRQKLNDEASAQ